MGIYAVRTTANKEKTVARRLVDKIEKEHYEISSIVVPGLKGYILIEGEKPEIDKAYRGVTHVRGVVEGQTTVSEIEHFLAPKPAVTKLEVGFIVEVTAGPFKGEKAKITNMDTAKNEVTIELIEATVPIPITIPAESVRVLEKKEAKKEGEESEGKTETEEPEIRKEEKEEFKMPE